jgi:hypothetical protein
VSNLEAANALSKDIIVLISSARRSSNRDTSTRAVFVALADVAAFVIKEWYKPEYRDEAVEWLASLVKSQIRDPLDEAALIRLWHKKRGDQSEENDQ